MRPLPLTRVIALLLIALPGAALTGCSSTGGDGGGPEDCDALLAAAEAALETELARLSDLESAPGPGEVDFTAAQAAYDAALDCDPDNPDAQFGAGLTGFLALSQNQELADALAEFTALIDTTDILGAPAAPGGLVTPEIGGLASGFAAPPPLAWPLARGFLALPMAALRNPGPVEDLQNAIETVALPLVDAAIGLLDLVGAQPDFTFTITPEMQGDPAADPAELDLTEVYLALVPLNLVRSWGGLAVSYSFDLASFDSAGVRQALEQDSGFLALRPNGDELMADSHAHLLAVFDRLIDALEYLAAETDPQGDDIIKMDGDEAPTEEEIGLIVDLLQEARDGLAAPFAAEADFDGDGFTETVTVDLAGFMTGAPENLKALLPPYTTDWVGDAVEGCPVIVWDATTFDEWDFPDPTWGGLFPDIATSDEFKATFGMDEASVEWQQYQVMGDCDLPVARLARR